jgi:hypothetical protein
MNSKDLIKKINETLTSLKVTVPIFYLNFGYEGLSKKIKDPYKGKTKAKLAEALLSSCGPFSVENSERLGSDFDLEQTVFHFKDHDVYLALYGSYSSYDSTDYSHAEFVEVKPREQTIIVYDMV